MKKKRRVYTYLLVVLAELCLLALAAYFMKDWTFMGSSFTTITVILFIIPGLITSILFNAIAYLFERKKKKKFSLIQLLLLQLLIIPIFIVIQPYLTRWVIVLLFIISNTSPLS